MRECCNSAEVLTTQPSSFGRTPASEAGLADASFLLKQARAIARFRLQRRRVVFLAEEADKIRALTAELSTAVQRIEAEVSVTHVDDQLRSLSAVRKRLLRQIALHHSLVAPIWRLPPEILSRIFIYVDALHEDDLQWDVRSVLRTLARVCHVWRVATCATPQLWSRFTASLSGGSILPVLSLLRLSGSVPLVIHYTPNVPSEGTLLVLFHHLKPHTAHWGSITLCGSSEIFASQPCVDLPSLEEASLIIVQDTVNHTTFTLTRHGMLGFLFAAPRLKRLKLSSEFNPIFYYNGRWTALDLPVCPHLAQLTLRMPYIHINMDELVGWLEASGASLTSLILDVQFREGDGAFGHGGTTPASGSRPVHLPRLRSLDLGVDSACFLAHIIAPSLEDLALHMSRLVPQSPFFALLAFAFQPGASLPSLRRLTLTGSGYWLYGTFWTCAECMDGLRELRLRGKASWQPILSKELLAKMTCDSEMSSCGTEPSDTIVGLTLAESIVRKPLFPSLTTFKVNFEDKLPTPSLRHALDDMVASRSESRTVDGRVVARLANVEVKTV